ncbi:hypothetical protein TKK_0012509 [Trichogramma kaykai]
MPPERASIGRSSSRARYQRILRSSEPPEDRQARLQASQVQTAQARSSETNEQRAERLQADRLRLARIRANETLDRRTSRLAADRERRVQRGVSLSLHHAAFHYAPRIDYSHHEKVIFGKMDKLCEFCGAFKFKNEPPGMCCVGGKGKLPDLTVPP